MNLTLILLDFRPIALTRKNDILKKQKSMNPITMYLQFILFDFLPVQLSEPLSGKQPMLIHQRAITCKRKFIYSIFSNDSEEVIQ